MDIKRIKESEPDMSLLAYIAVGIFLAGTGYASFHAGSSVLIGVALFFSLPVIIFIRDSVIRLTRLASLIASILVGAKQVGVFGVSVVEYGSQMVPKILIGLKRTLLGSACLMALSLVIL